MSEKLFATAKVDLSGVRIARISTVPFFVLTQLGGQLELLKRLGADVTVVTSEGPELPALAAMDVGSILLIDIQRAVSPWSDLLALVRLYRFFRRSHINIAHSTTPKAGLITAIAALLARVPVRLHTFTGQPWVNMKGIKRSLVRWVDWLIGMLNTRCYADSKSQRLFLLQHGVMRPEKLGVIGEGSLAGVNLQRFDSGRFDPVTRRKLRASLGIPINAAVLLFVGRITEEKGIRELLAAYTKIKSTGRCADLIMVGQFDNNGGVNGSIGKDEIEHIDGTHLVGYSDCPEAYMAIADILCLPSYREGFGTVVIEAAAMGLPTVGSAIYGLTDAVVHDETGFLVSPLDSDALAVALLRLLDDRALRRKMGEAARARVEVDFDAKVVNMNVAQEYAAMLKTGKT